LFGMAAVCAGLASSMVSGYARDIREQVGPLTPVMVVRASVPRGKLFTPSNVQRYLVARRVPVRFVPPRSFRFAADVVGLRSLTPIPAGSYVTEGQLGGSAPGGNSQRAGGRTGRVVEVPVAGAAALQGVLRPGARVDVLITSDRGPGTPRTYLALQRIELIDIRAGDGASGGESQESMAALRVTLRQAVLLTAAQNFARELRLVPRAHGEDRLLGPTAVSAHDLHP
jgi:pilus assembly protein CpaB